MPVRLLCSTLNAVFLKPGAGIDQEIELSDRAQSRKVGCGKLSFSCPITVPKSSLQAFQEPPRPWGRSAISSHTRSRPLRVKSKDCSSEDALLNGRHRESERC